MEAQEAFRILGLTGSETVEEIDSRFREMILKEHPDVGGSSDRTIELNQARVVARGTSQRNGARVATVAAPKVEIKPTPPKAAGQEAPPSRPVSDPIILKMLAGNIRPLRQEALAAGLLLAVSLVAMRFAARGFSSEHRDILRLILYMTASLFLAIASAITAVRQGMAVGQYRRWGQALTGLLDDKRRFRTIINDLLPDLVGKEPIGRKRLENEAERHVRQMLRKLHANPWPETAAHLSQQEMSLINDALAGGPERPTSFLSVLWRRRSRGASHDFGRLVIEKGLEHGYVQEHQLIQRGAPWTGYTVSAR